MTAAPDVKTLIALFVVGMVAACFDAIAGGGGLLTLPALLVAGLNPVAAIATNKLQSSGGSVSATIVFARRGLMSWPLAWAFVAGAGVASVAGALCVTLLPRDLLAASVPVVLIGVALYFAFNRRPSEADSTARMGPMAFAGSYLAVIGFYDGVFGPGTGSFYMIGFITLLGYGVLRATAPHQVGERGRNPIRGARLLRVLRQDRLARRSRDARRRLHRRSDRLASRDPPRCPFDSGRFS